MSDAELDAARIVLEICAVLQLRPGRSLWLKSAWQLGIQFGLNGPEVAAAIKKCVALGWLEERDQSTYLLTEAGFTAMKQCSE